MNKTAAFQPDVQIIRKICVKISQNYDILG